MKPYHKILKCDTVNSGGVMSNIIDIHTKTPIKYKPPKRQRATSNLIEGIYQRRYQIDDIVVGYFEKSTGQFRFGCTGRDPFVVRQLRQAVDDYFSNMLIYLDSEDDS